MKNSNHASKALAVVLSGALAFAPVANAALDESNMAYDSAAEGFYGSLRVQYANNDTGPGVDNDANIEAEGSRLGVRGDVDLGGGLEAFYGFEWNLGNPADSDDSSGDGSALKTRQHHVGLKGDWGAIWLGAFDSVIVRFGGFSTTDILDQYSGNFEPIYRTSNAVAYVSPDLNGFQFGIEASAQDGAKREVTTRLAPALNTIRDVDSDDGNDFDNVGLGAAYSIQGLTFSGAYFQQSDVLEEYDSGEPNFIEDVDQYALGISYNQDNWIVAAMYGEKSVGDYYDQPFLSLAAGVSIDKLEIHGLWEQQTIEASGFSDEDTTITAITARYNLGSKSRLRAGWKNTDDDSDDATSYALGLQVDF